MATIDIKISLKGSLHIGGVVAGTADSAAPFVRDARGRPCIPAATLKGVHRAATEQIAAALGFAVCNVPVASHMCHPVSGKPGCVVCRIFGSPWLLGKVYYRDLVSTAAVITDHRVAAPQSRRRRVQLGRYTRSRETLPGGLTLTGRIDYLLVDPALVGLMLAGLRSITAIGAGSASGYGLCAVEAKAFDALKRPVDESQLAAALSRLAKGQP